MVNALCSEIALRKGELKQVNTLYFGGGTPSLLSVSDIDRMITEIGKWYDVSSLDEVTLEANPDDISKEWLAELKEAGINRLSIGVQSFFDEDLLWMNRAHSARLASSSIKMAQDAGFGNITIDLIYGSPSTTDQIWAANLEQWLNLELPHLSAYALTVEPKTALEGMIRKGKSLPVDDATAVRQLQYLQSWAAQNNVSHYEISNLCIAENYAQHNTNYWFGQPYLGIGPSAHSYDGANLRRWNVANNLAYLKAIKQGDAYWDSEALSAEDICNEYIMTRLRTKWGIDLNAFTQKFGEQQTQQLRTEAQPWVNDGMLKEGSALVLTPKGKALGDRIIASLFI